MNESSPGPLLGRWWIVLLALLGLGLRLYSLGSLSLWNDEAVSLESALAPSAGSLLVFNLWADVHPPLYPLLLRLWLAPGASEYLARFLSVGCGVLLIPVIYQVGRRLFGERWGRLAAFLTAVSPFFIYYSREVRMYSLVALLVALSVLFFLKIVVGEGGWAWLGYGVTMVAALYTDYPAFLVLVGLNGFVVLFWSRYRPLARSWLALQGLLLALYLPGLAGAAYQAANRGSGFWLPAVTWDAIPNTLATFAFGHTLDGLAQVFALTLSLIVLLVWMLRWSQDRRMVLLGLWLLLPLLGFYLVSLLFFSIYLERSLIVAAPALVLAAALGLGNVPLMPLRLLLLGLWLALGVISLMNLYASPDYARPALAQGAAYLASSALPSDLVVHTSFLSYEPLVVYHRLLGRSLGDEVVLDAQLGQAGQRQVFGQGKGLGGFLLSATPLGGWRQEAADYLDRVLGESVVDEAGLAARAQGRDSLWLVEMTPQAQHQVAQPTFLQRRYWQPPLQPDLTEAAWLQQGFRLAQEKRLPGLNLYLYRRAA